jgi:hypothetical protein
MRTTSIAARRGATLLDVTGEVGVQVHEHPVAALAALGNSTGEAPHPAAERRVVLARNAEQVGDHQQREGVRVGPAELDLAAVDELVDQLLGEARHELLVVLEAVRREELVEQRPVPGVLGRIEGDEHVAERDFVAAIFDDILDGLSRARVRQLRERAERRDHRRIGIVIGVHREDLLDAGDQEDAVMGLAHHRTELAKSRVVGIRIPDDLGIGEEVAVENVHAGLRPSAALTCRIPSRRWRTASRTPWPSAS